MQLDDWLIFIAILWYKSAYFVSVLDALLPWVILSKGVARLQLNHQSNQNRLRSCKEKLDDIRLSLSVSSAVRKLLPSESEIQLASFDQITVLFIRHDSDVSSIESHSKKSEWNCITDEADWVSCVWLVILERFLFLLQTQRRMIVRQVLLGLAGLGVPCYAYYVKEQLKNDHRYRAFCDLGAHANCTRVLTSK
jgi:hypothetical protein